jgi:hypothetical protein
MGGVRAGGVNGPADFSGRPRLRADWSGRHPTNTNTNINANATPTQCGQRRTGPQAALWQID